MKDGLKRGLSAQQDTTNGSWSGCGMGDEAVTRTRKLTRDVGEREREKRSVVCLGGAGGRVWSFCDGVGREMEKLPLTCQLTSIHALERDRRQIHVSAASRRPWCTPLHSTLQASACHAAEKKLAVQNFTCRFTCPLLPPPYHRLHKPRGAVCCISGESAARLPCWAEAKGLHQAFRLP
jgi:hypothetical protein